MQKYEKNHKLLPLRNFLQVRRLRFIVFISVKNQCFAKKNKKYFAISKNVYTFAPAFERKIEQKAAQVVELVDTLL